MALGQKVVLLRSVAKRPPSRNNHVNVQRGRGGNLLLKGTWDKGRLKKVKKKKMGVVGIVGFGKRRRNGWSSIVGGKGDCMTQTSKNRGKNPDEEEEITILESEVKREKKKKNRELTAFFGCPECFDEIVGALKKKEE